MTLRYRFLGLACLLVVCWFGAAAGAAERRKVFIESTVDGTLQPSYLTLPHGLELPDAPLTPNERNASGKKRPLLVSLHSWSADLEQRRPQLEAAAAERGWVCLQPNFRGPNKHPDACGSTKAQQDILDAVQWVRDRLPIDSRRIYLTGVSGGGHMTLLMAGRHPELWAAASAWVGISDLASWHQKHGADRYGEMLRQSCGGAPGSSPEVDVQYRQRSPLTWLHRAKGVPLDIAAGIHDGHTGSVPIRHSLEAFNVIARAGGERPVSESEMKQLAAPDGRLENPLPGDRAKDPTFGREIHLRRRAGPARVTIFEGGHEGIDSAAIAWLSRHAKAE